MKKILLILLLVFLTACSNPDFFEHSTENAHVKYENGILDYQITVEKPTPCYTIGKEELIMESYPVQIVIDMYLIPSEDICIQVVTKEIVEGSLEIGHKPGSLTIILGEEVLYSTNFI
tara:strand:+ start:878 stop:1231 length:354 start_codon:yes stop_codon:yes gene_type:complete